MINLDIPKGFEAEVRFYCSTCQEEVEEDMMWENDFKTHECEESK
jgi:hypothetical protein